MRDEIVYQTKKPVWVVCFVLVCVQVIPSVSAFYLNFKSEDGKKLVVQGQISLDAIEITSGHSSVDQSDKKELLRKLDDLKTQIEARVSNADSELRQIKMIEAETRKLIGATTSWDERDGISILDGTTASLRATSQMPDNTKANVFDTNITSQTEQMQTTTELAEEIDPKVLIEEAIRNDDEIKTAELISKFYNVDGERRFRPLNVAAETCSVKVAEMLLQKGADVNVIGGIGWNPIHVATCTNCEPIVKMLIEHGADLSASSVFGYTALDRARFNDFKNIVNLLEEAVEGMDTQEIQY